MKNKKGLSDVIGTLMIILLVVVAVALLWIPVRNLINNSSEKFDGGTKCLDVDVQVTKVVRANDNADLTTNPNRNKIYNVTIERFDNGAFDINGVDLAFENSAGTANHVSEIMLNIPALKILTKKVTLSRNLVPTKVKVNAFFISEKGKKFACPNQQVYDVYPAL